MTTKIIKAFEKEVNLTEEGLAVLVADKKSLVIEFDTKAGMTIARKERTERNKTIESVKRVSIDTENAIKARRAAIIEEVTKAYSCIVEPFEKEELRLKQVKEKEAELEKQRVQSIRDQIGTIRGFANNLYGLSSQELSDIIESVDLIDVDEVFAEFTQEAMQVKKETLTELNVTLSGAIQKENLAEEQAKLEVEKLKLKAQDRLNTLMMIPTTMFGKTSEEINVKIKSLDNYQVKEEEFGVLFDQANAAKVQVIIQLGTMYTQQVLVEQAQLQQPAEETKLSGKMAEAFNEIFEPVESFTSDTAKPVTQNRMHVAVTKKPELEPHDEMMQQVKFWAGEYSINGSALNDLENILNQYK